MNDDNGNKYYVFIFMYLYLLFALYPEILKNIKKTRTKLFVLRDRRMLPSGFRKIYHFQ